MSTTGVSHRGQGYRRMEFPVVEVVVSTKKKVSGRDSDVARIATFTLVVNSWLMLSTGWAGQQSDIPSVIFY